MYPVQGLKEVPKRFYGMMKQVAQRTSWEPKYKWVNLRSLVPSGRLRLGAEAAEFYLQTES